MPQRNIKKNRLLEEIIKYFLSFFKRQDGKRSYLGFGILITLILITNYFFGFSDQYKFEKKIENLKSIENLLADKKLDKNVAKYLKNKRNEIITEIKFNENEIYLTSQKEVKYFLDFRKFPLLHYLSSSWLFILLTIYFPISLSRRNTVLPGTFFASRLLTISVMSLTVYVLSIIYASLLELVPIFSYKNLWINYVFNFFSIFLVLILLFMSYQLLNYGSNYAEFEKEKSEENFTNKNNLVDPFKNSALGEVIGDKNPILWAGEIVKYNFKENNTLFNILFSIFLILFTFFTLFSVCYTTYQLIIKYCC